MKKDEKPLHFDGEEGSGERSRIENRPISTSLLACVWSFTMNLDHQFLVGHVVRQLDHSDPYSQGACIRGAPTLT